MPTKIPWTDETWNAVTGCTKKSSGCKNCYALRMAWRLMHSDKPQARAAYAGVAEKRDGKVYWTGRVNCLSERLGQPAQWKKGRRIFLPSMGDLLHKSVPDDFIFDVLTVVVQCPQHTFQLLTKRARRLAHLWRHAKIDAYPNLWIGVTTENQKCFDERWNAVRQFVSVVPVLFFSCEPLLSEIKLPVSFVHAARMSSTKFQIIVGCETGPGARPMELDWARSLRDQCQNADVAFFYKQGADHSPMSEFRLTKAPLTNVLDGREWTEMPK